MFEIIKDINKDIDELNILNDYVKYLVKKLKLDKCEFNIIIIDNQRIHEINKEYRNVDRETDVISFAMEDHMDIQYEDSYIWLQRYRRNMFEFQGILMVWIYDNIKPAHVLGCDRFLLLTDRNHDRL